MKDQTLNVKINFDKETNLTTMDTTFFDENGNLEGTITKEFKGDQEETLLKWIHGVTKAADFTDITSATLEAMNTINDDERHILTETLTEKQVDAIEFEKDEDNADD